MSGGPARLPKRALQIRQVDIGKGVVRALSVAQVVVIHLVEGGVELGPCADIGQLAAVVDVHLAPLVLWLVPGHLAGLPSSFSGGGGDAAGPSPLPVVVRGAEDGTRKGLAHGFARGAAGARFQQIVLVVAAALARGVTLVAVGRLRSLF